jgi:hypothetical protein
MALSEAHPQQWSLHSAVDKCSDTDEIPFDSLGQYSTRYADY